MEAENYNVRRILPEHGLMIAMLVHTTSHWAFWMCFMLLALPFKALQRQKHIPTERRETTYPIWLYLCEIIP